MKSLFAVAVYLVVIVTVKGEISDEQKQMMQMLHNNCVKETSVTEDTITGASKGTFAEDDKLKCYMKCVFVQMGVLSEEDWTVDKEAFVEMVPENMKESIAKALEKCTPLSGDNGCEKAFNLNKCFYSTDPEKYMII